MIAFRQALAPLGFVIVLIASSLCDAATDRTAEAILADYKAVTFPIRDPARTGPEATREFRAAYGKAQARKDQLALELFQAHPDHEAVPGLLKNRWINTMMSPSTAAATIAEINQALPCFKVPDAAREARFMRAIATIQANLETSEAAVATVEAFLLEDPKDRRSELLLSGFASTVQDPTLRSRLLKRLIAEYPDAPASKSARATLAILENIGKPLDLEFTDAIKGTTVSIKGLKGKVVVLDFWATWCGPCVAEIPRMKKLYAQFKDQGVEFIGVSLDVPKDEGGLDKLKAFVAKNEIPWHQYYQGEGFESEFSTRMGISIIPQLFLIDAEGKLASIDARKKLETLIPAYLEKAKATSHAR
jgi:thiol-disulfide isomerase/thioredoxin